MTNKITTGNNVVGGTENKRTPEQKEKDKKIVDGYKVSIDQLKLEINRLEKAIELDLPIREYKTQIEEINTKIEQYEKLKKTIEERNK